MGSGFQIGLRLVLAVTAAVALGTGCGRGYSRSQTLASVSPPTEPPPTARYPRARWRLASYDELNRTVFWLSHIVITHESSHPEASLLRCESWTPDSISRDRKEREALALATRISDEAREDPSAFERLAKRYSDDSITKDAGGFFGGIAAGQLPPEFLDALAVLREGEVSEVVRTAFGYHVLRRHSPPKQTLVSGQRIIVRYRGICSHRLDRPTDRTRADALRIAGNLSMKARAEDGVAFGRLAKAGGGEGVDFEDLGVFSTWEPGFLAMEVHRLSELQAGQASEPVDSREGFEVLMRTNEQTKREFAMDRVAIKFDPTVPPDDEHSKLNALVLATKVAGDVTARPELFDTYRQKYCCSDIERWNSGHRTIEPVLQQLAFGEIAKSVTEYDWFYVLPRRLDPASVPAASVRYELPSPRCPDFERLVQINDGAALANGIRTFSSEAAAALHLPANEGNSISKELEGLAVSMGAPTPSASERSGLWNRSMKRLQETLGNDSYGAFHDYLCDWAAALIVDSGP